MYISCFSDMNDRKTSNSRLELFHNGSVLKYAERENVASLLLSKIALFCNTLEEEKKRKVFSLSL